MIGLRKQMYCKRPVLVLWLALMIIPCILTESSHAERPTETDGALTLPVLIERAEQDAPGARARMEEMKASMLLRDSLPDWYRPNIRGEAGFGGAANTNESRHGPIARIISEWELWDGGRTSAARRHLTHMAQLDELNARKELMTLRLQIGQYFFETARLRSLQTLRRAEIATYTRVRALLYPRLRIGTVGNSEVETISIKISELQQMNTAGEDRIDSLESAVGTITGWQDDRPPVPELVSLQEEDSFSIIAIEAIDPRETLSYRIARTRMKIISAGTDALEAQLYNPSLSLELYGGYGPQLDAIDSYKPEIGARVSITVPLYSNRSRAAQLASARAELQAARLEIEHSLRLAQLELDQLLNQISTSRNTINRLDELIVRAERNLRVSQVEFSRGIKAPADLQSAVEAVYDLNARRIAETYELYLALHRLDALTNVGTRSPEPENNEI
ncbi:MAG: TolC family protein [Leptospiraceae bacterium]|nr:TolC family protein [Leptospiraceae bacterium]